MSNFRLVAVLLGSLAAWPAWGQEGMVWLDPASCAPCPVRLLRTLPPAWREYWHFVQLCPLTDPQGQVALTVMTPRIDLAETAMAASRHSILGYFSREGAVAPDSLYLVDRKFNLIGEIATRFPLDPPYRVALGFGVWRDGFPQHIEVRRGEDARPLLLEWNPGQHWFRASPAP